MRSSRSATLAGATDDRRTKRSLTGPAHQSGAEDYMHVTFEERPALHGMRIAVVTLDAAQQLNALSLLVTPLDTRLDTDLVRLNGPAARQRLRLRGLRRDTALLRCARPGAGGNPARRQGATARPGQALWRRPAE